MVFKIKTAFMKEILAGAVAELAGLIAPEVAPTPSGAYYTINAKHM